MKINLVSLEDSVTAIGLRRVAAFVERINPDTHVHFVGTAHRSLLNSLLGKHGDRGHFGSEDLDLVAEGVANADVIGLSSMTGYSEITREVVTRIRRLNPKAFVVWGGIHPIIYPENAIEADVDAICTGEGEFAMAELLHHLESGSDHRRVMNMWFKDRSSGEIVRNPFRPLMNARELETMPITRYGGVEWMFRRGKGFDAMRTGDYLASNGLGYPAIWSIGCPLHCTYCGNTVFIENDKDYMKIRHPSSEWMISEIEHVKRVHPHVRTILFHDDSFMAIPLREITDFATKWRERVNLPFVVYGIIPTYVKREKLEVLTWAGMNRVRMGIQSGSERILKFYKRPTPIPRVEQAASVIAEFSKYHIPPAYDMIVDNPIETRQDVVDTLELVYRLARPFKLNMYSLRLIPNTVLQKQMEEAGVDIEHVNANFHTVRPTWANVLLNVLMFWRPPRRLFDRMLKHVRAFGEPQKSHQLLLHLSRAPWGARQILRHVRFGDFSTIPGWAGWLAWRFGLLALWVKLFERKLDLPPERLVVDPPRMRELPAP
jgi:radical SAM superfamily enzyme YgiQ (UPF0313 family)